MFTGTQAVQMHITAIKGCVNNSVGTIETVMIIIIFTLGT